MTEEQLLEVLSRLTPALPADLDADLFDVTATQGGTLLAVDSPNPSSQLWARTENEVAYIGIRETAPLPNYAQTAAHLISAGLERGVAPIILCALDRSGFTRFGMRVERLTLGADQDACEAQLSAFWDLAIILDAEQIAAFG